MPWAANMPPLSYWEVTILVADPKALEEAQDFLYGIGADGLQWEDGLVVDSPFADIRLPAGEPFVRAYFLSDDRWEWRQEAILARFGAQASFASVKAEDWENNWKQYYVPIVVSDRVIMPAWHRASPFPEQRTIWLDPGMAFGTGTHATTQMCLQRILVHPVLGQRVLDLGSGSGVLAIAAAKAGAAKVVAVEPDPVALTALASNIRRNGVTVEVVSGTLSQVELQTFDLIVMNLITEIIVAEWSHVIQYATPTARLVLSGIVDDRLEEVLAALGATFYQVAWIERREGWVALEATR